MIKGLYPEGVLSPDDKKVSAQSLLFGHRIKPQQTLYEYLIEFLIVANAHKKIENGTDKVIPEMFPISDELKNHALTYMPKSNMGLKRFIFFDNSRIDTRAEVDKQAYNTCLEIIKKQIDNDNSNFDKDACLFVLQNILYGFSVENGGRSWFNKNLLPVSVEVLFPESLGTQELRKSVTIEDAEIDKKFSFNSYTYMCRGGEVYYLHLLHAINAYPDSKPIIEKYLSMMLNSMPEVTELSKFIQDNWVNEQGITLSTDNEPDVSKTMSAIPIGFESRDKYTVSELEYFLSCKMQPMEKLDIFSYGIMLQMLRMMFNVAAESAETGNSAWVLDLSLDEQREKSEIKKLASIGYDKNEESVIKYLNYGIDYYFGGTPNDEKEKLFHKAETDTYKLFRKLAKKIGILIPLKGSGMRFTLSEEIIKFLVMSLIPAGSKITFEYFLQLMYEHFGMIVSPEQYKFAAEKGMVMKNDNVTFLNSNKTAFAQKLKECGFLRDLSDATAIVENPYEKEEISLENDC